MRYARCQFLRVKAPEIFWSPENAERMLYLRANALREQWNDDGRDSRMPGTTEPGKRIGMGTDPLLAKSTRK